MSEIFDLFKKEFNVNVPISLELREAIEDIWLRKYYEEGTEYYNGEEIPVIGTYELNYYADQWYGVDLVKQGKMIFKGEGDTPFEALLHLTIEAKSLLYDEDFEFLQNMDKYIEKYEDCYKCQA